MGPPACAQGAVAVMDIDKEVFFRRQRRSGPAAAGADDPVHRMHRGGMVAGGERLRRADLDVGHVDVDAAPVGEPVPAPLAPRAMAPVLGTDPSEGADAVELAEDAAGG